ncbi:MAG: hypothetical protein ABSE84_30130, partial [Isosphaeraceae bacterium]
MLLLFALPGVAECLGGGFPFPAEALAVCGGLDHEVKDLGADSRQFKLGGFGFHRRSGGELAEAG